MLSYSFSKFFTTMDVTFAKNQSFFTNIYLQGRVQVKLSFSLMVCLLCLDFLNPCLFHLRSDLQVLLPCHLVKNPHQKWIKGELMQFTCHYKFTVCGNRPNLIKCKLKSLNPSQIMNTQTPLNFFFFDRKPHQNILIEKKYKRRMRNPPTKRKLDNKKK